MRCILAPEGEAQVLCDLVSTHQNLCCDTFEALEVSGFTQVQNERKIDVLNLYGLEKSAFAQIQFAVLEVLF